MKQLDTNSIRDDVRKKYGAIASVNSQTLSKDAASSCCGGSGVMIENLSKMMGYSNKDLAHTPHQANMGLGCGNPTAIASLKQGETVLDLGSGGGFDCFLAAGEVGESGKVIGVDMTPEMVSLARKNAAEINLKNVEFRLGEIENLPASDNSVNVVISNCVINLSPNKKRVFQEAFRVLTPQGRLMVSDIVLLKELPEKIAGNFEAYAGCLAGAELKDRYLNLIREAGFQQVEIVEETTFPLENLISESTAKELARALDVTTEKLKEIGRSVASVKVSGIKPTE